MDKKRYVKPEMQAVKVKLVHNVCSGGVGNVGGNSGMGYGGGGSGIAKGSVRADFEEMKDLIGGMEW